MVTGRGLANGCYRIDLVRIERDEFLDLDLHAHARRLRRDAMVGVLLETGTAVGAHEDPPCFLAVFQIPIMRPSGSVKRENAQTIRPRPSSSTRRSWASSRSKL